MDWKNNENQNLKHDEMEKESREKVDMSLESKKSNRAPFIFQLITAVLCALSIFLVFIFHNQVSFRSTDSYWTSAGMVRYVNDFGLAISSDAIDYHCASLWKKLDADSPISLLLGFNNDKNKELAYYSALAKNKDDPEAQKRAASLLELDSEYFYDNPENKEIVRKTFYRKKDLEAWAKKGFISNSKSVYMEPGEESYNDEKHFISPEQITSANSDLKKLVSEYNNKQELEMVVEEYKPMDQASLLDASKQNIDLYQGMTNSLKNLVQDMVPHFESATKGLSPVSKNIYYKLTGPEGILYSNQKERDMSRPWTAPIIISNENTRIGQGPKSEELSQAYLSASPVNLMGSPYDLPQDWTLEIRIDSSLPEHDIAHYMNQNYGSFYKIRWAALIVGIISVIGWAVSLGIFLKRTTNKGRPALRKIEGAIPLEIYLIAGACFLAALTDLISITNPEINQLFKEDVLFLVGGISLLLELIGLYILSAIVRKWKQGKFFKGSICYWIGHFFSKLYKKLSQGKSVKHQHVYSYLAWGFIGGFIVLLLSFLTGNNAVFVIAFVFWAISGLWLTARKDAEFNQLYKKMNDLVVGNFQNKLSPEEFHGANKEVAKTLNQLDQGIERAAQKEASSKILQTELITNVSHDLKTPLTSIINYVNLLKDEPLPEEGHAKEYLDILDKKSKRLQVLINDLIEASKASSGAMEVELQELDFAELVSQILAEHEEGWAKKELSPVVHVQQKPCPIQADGEKLSRVLENLLVNAQKYSLPKSRVYIDLLREDGQALFVIKNISEKPLNVKVDDLLRRFSRGDEARAEEGSGLGLSIADSFTQRMNGKFHLDIDGDLFKASVSFPFSGAEESTEEEEIKETEVELVDEDVDKEDQQKN